jgi:hypothetical protein
MTGFIVGVFPSRNRVSSTEAFEGVILHSSGPRCEVAMSSTQSSYWCAIARSLYRESDARKIRYTISPFERKPKVDIPCEGKAHFSVKRGLTQVVCFRVARREGRPGMSPNLQMFAQDFSKEELRTVCAIP